MIHPVVVENNSFKGRLHMLSPLVLAEGFPPRAVVNGFFTCLFPTAVLHTIASVQPDGVEEKGYTVCRKARGQFPNSPCDWSNHQVEGRGESQHDDPVYRGKEPSLSTLFVGGRGVFG